MSILDNIRPLRTPNLTGFIKVTIDGHVVGWTKQSFAAVISDFDDTWQLDGNALVLNPALEAFDERTIAIDKTFLKLSANGHLPPMPDYTGLGQIDWYALSPAFGKDAQAAVKRFYAPYLGAKNETVILNGYNSHGYWVAKRGQLVHEEPGKMDIITAGAVDYRHKIPDVLLEEAATEAGLNAPQMQRSKNAGTLSLYYLNDEGFLRDELFHIFDIDTGDDIIPKSCHPIEVEGFHLVHFAELGPMLENGKIFKSQINMVVADFMVRHGYQIPGLEAVQQFLYEERRIEDFVR